VPKNLTWHVAPDFVVEIIRGSEQTEQVSAWLDQYFHAGVNRVWVVYPDRLEIHDHDSLSSSRVLDRNQSLDGGSILPGFQMPVKALVADADE
jgi:Uma2 family endonuclease